MVAVNTTPTVVVPAGSARSVLTNTGSEQITLRMAGMANEVLRKGLVGASAVLTPVADIYAFTASGTSALSVTTAVADPGSAVVGSSSTAGRPVFSSSVVVQWWDTTLGKPIWWNGSAWKDATGATV